MSIMEDILKDPNLLETLDPFGDICRQMYDTYQQKNHDYGNAFSEMYDELGINYGYGKIREKVNRIKVLKDNAPKVKSEPLEDALLDCANYCILTLMEYRKRHNTSNEGTNIQLY
jgi:isopropylmalate/homocitrate/citramalate synthase